MSANPSTTFFWNDWDNDLGLKTCSLAAQGLWMRMLSICARSDRLGYLRVNRTELDLPTLASLVGKPAYELASLIIEMDHSGVFSRDRSGCIYNRRMVKDAKRHLASAKGGKIGGAVSVRNKRGIFATPGPTPGGTPPPLVPKTHTPKPEGRNTEVCLSTESDSEKPSSTSRAVRAKKVRARSPTPIPPDWQLSPEGREFARAKGHDDVWIDAEVEHFHEAALAHDRRYSNWDAAWRMWVIKAPAFARKSGVNSHVNDAGLTPGASIVVAAERAVRELEEDRRRNREPAQLVLEGRRAAGGA